jgi:hypothetical protein
MLQMLLSAGSLQKVTSCRRFKKHTASVIGYEVMKCFLSSDKSDPLKRR